ncbi:hypothetical protein NQ317_017676 [Molorchus minor]|uniref:Uncharacterized protein n=1 Tax=Molorchus minor TaxID=1323400 RepID=A0ABQ9JNF5_9CUCU|nr:hypothetical protein NQ317_017676 [Molorchus minor]
MSTIDKKSAMSVKSSVTSKETIDKFKEDINEMVNSRLQELDVSRLHIYQEIRRKSKSTVSEGKLTPSKSPSSVINISYRKKSREVDDEVQGKSEPHTKSVLKNYPSIGSLTKKKVLFDIETDESKIENAKNSVGVDKEEVQKEEEKEKKNDSFSDFDLSEL